MDLKSWVSDLEPWLTVIGSACVIAGTVFVVIQMRMNAKQAASATAFQIISKVTDPSFAERRHLLYEMSAKHASSDWAGYDRSLEDFEVRSYANIYEQLGLFVRRGLVDLGDVMEALSAQVMADWFTFEPIRTHIMEISGARFAAVATDQPGIDNVYWPNFMWLAARNVEWVQQQATTPGWAALPAVTPDAQATSPPGRQAK